MPMNRIRLLLGLAAVFAFVLLTRAAPAPSPESQGPISDAMRMRGKVPATSAPSGTRVSRIDDNSLQVDRVMMQYVSEARTVNVEVDGMTQQRTEVVTRAVPVVYKEQVAVEKCKFYTVTKDGKLETLEAKKATALLKKPVAVLTGDSADVDARHLEMVKEGSLYIVLPPPGPQQILPPGGFPMPKDEKKEG
jgi:hypothetical protein